MNSIISNITTSWGEFNFTVALIIFLAYLVVDGLYAYYTLSVTKRKPFTAATTGFLMHFIIAFGVLNYVNNFLYVVPLAIGSWVGTYLVVKQEKENFEHDQNK